MILHLVLLALAAFCIWEAARPLLPHNLTDWAVAVLLFGVAAALDQWASDRVIGLLGVVSVVGILHQKFGASGTGTYAIRAPRRRSRVSLP